MNRSGLSLAILLIVALIVAYLAMSGMKGLHVGGAPGAASDVGERAVDQARELVDQLNAAQRKAMEPLEEPQP